MGPVSVTMAGLVAKNHGENRGWNYLRLKMEYYHWKTYFLPRLGTLYESGQLYRTANMFSELIADVIFLPYR